MTPKPPLRGSTLLAIVSLVLISLGVVTALVILNRDPSQVVYLLGIYIPAVIGAIAGVRKVESVQNTLSNQNDQLTSAATKLDENAAAVSQVQQQTNGRMRQLHEIIASQQHALTEIAKAAGMPPAPEIPTYETISQKTPNPNAVKPTE